MRIRAAAALIASVTLWVGVTAATSPAEAEAPQLPVTVAHVEEDSPSWDCATMGNHVCGPTQASYTDASGTAWTWVSAEAGFEPVGAN